MQLLLTLLLALATPTQFAGITLGETAEQLIAERGDPMLEAHSAGRTTWMYLSPGGEYAEAVGVSRGYVEYAVIFRRNLELPTMHDDISVAGLRVGDPYSTVPSEAQRHGMLIDGVMYFFNPTKDRTFIGSIAGGLSDDQIAKLPLKDVPLIHNGASFDDAVVVRASTDFLGTAFEHGYMSAHNFCAPGNVKMLKQSLAHQGAKTYDIIVAGCNNSDKTQSMYFDITDSFGKH